MMPEPAMRLLYADSRDAGPRPPLPGMTESAAYALNAGGQVVVGHFVKHRQLKRATLWRKTASRLT